MLENVKAPKIVLYVEIVNGTAVCADGASGYALHAILYFGGDGGAEGVGGDGGDGGDGGGWL